MRINEIELVVFLLLSKKCFVEMFFVYNSGLYYFIIFYDKLLPSVACYLYICTMITSMLYIIIVILLALSGRKHTYLIALFMAKLLPEHVFLFFFVFIFVFASFYTADLYISMVISIFSPFASFSCTCTKLNTINGLWLKY